MNTLEILFQIDAELDRLKRARAVLAKEPMPVKSRRRSSRGPASDPKSPLVAADLKPEPSAPLVTRYPAKEHRQRTLRQKNISLNDGIERKPTALCGSIPPGPIAVSAEEVRQVRARRNVDQDTAYSRLGTDLIQERPLRALISKLETLSAAPEISSQAENPFPSS